jgi:DNA (cytosine-5)-methyltransferase 1
MLRIISECGPRYAIFENVTGLLTGEQGRWFAQFLYDLAEIGYDAEWHCIEAAYVGAPHRRDRVWVIAYPNSECQQGRTKRSNLIKQQAWRVNSDIQNFPRLPNPNESPLLRVDDGISGRLDRSDARKRSARLGNSVVPQIPELIGKALMEFEKDNA